MANLESAILKCTLMHQNIPVLALEILADTGHVVLLGNILSPEHLPLTLQGKEMGKIERKQFNRWWLGRSIPASRVGIGEALQALNEQSPWALIEKCYGLSLSDHYWLKPDHVPLDWREINFFENEFSGDIGKLLFGEIQGGASLNLMSPDNTSDGWLRKKWIIREGKRYLLKGGSGDEQEPFNEVIATGLLARLGISHVPYTLEKQGDSYYSLCENFVTTDTEFIPAWQLMGVLKRINHESEYEHLIRCCEYVGMKQVRGSLEKMLTVDFLIANEDRHYNNFGFMRDAKTLAFQGLAPIFDSGTSLWYNTHNIGRETEAKPFKKTHAAQMTLIKDFSWFRVEQLDDIETLIIRTLTQGHQFAKERPPKIADCVRSNIQAIQKTKEEIS